MFYDEECAVETQPDQIDEIYYTTIKAGSASGKVSGTDRGFIFLYCQRNTRCDVIKALQEFEGEMRRFQFVKEGVKRWRL